MSGTLRERVSVMIRDLDRYQKESDLGWVFGDAPAIYIGGQKLMDVLVHVERALKPKRTCGTCRYWRIKKPDVSVGLGSCAQHVIVGSLPYTLRTFGCTFHVPAGAPNVE